MLLRPSESGIPEVSPARLDPSDRAGIRAHLEEQLTTWAKIIADAGVKAT